MNCLFSTKYNTKIISFFDVFYIFYGNFVRIRKWVSRTLTSFTEKDNSGIAQPEKKFPNETKINCQKVPYTDKKLKQSLETNWVNEPVTCLTPINQQKTKKKQHNQSPSSKKISKSPLTTCWKQQYRYFGPLHRIPRFSRWYRRYWPCHLRWCKWSGVWRFRRPWGAFCAPGPRRGRPL